MATKFIPRKKRGLGRDPLLVTRAPAPIVKLIRDAAAERQVPISHVIREVLSRHFEDVAA